MQEINPYRAKIKTLDDIGQISFAGRIAVEILREEMKFDPVHDEHHIVRVVRNALWFCPVGDKDVVCMAAVLHDLVNIPKDSPDRSKASRMSADKAMGLLEARLGLSPKDPRYQKTHNAIVAHSWSAKVEPRSVEADAVQDADRLEALGALGIARLFSGGGALGRELFHPTDPFGHNRKIDEVKYSLDHHYVKGRTLVQTMRTRRGKEIATVLFKRMETFIQDLVSEL